jgi:hypothetical protein
MTTRETLVGLAVRCEQATGPDRELDRAVWYALQDILSGDPAHGPTYTASLDAAMALLPPNWKLRQMQFSAPCADDRKWHLNLHGGREGEDTFVGRGASIALALTAACLRARAEGE